MQLYYHRTDGGAEYYSTTYTEDPETGHREGTAPGTVLRTDGGEIEVFTAALRAQGLRLVIDGKEYTA